MCDGVDGKEGGGLSFCQYFICWGLDKNKSCRKHAPFQVELCGLESVVRFCWRELLVLWRLVFCEVE